MNRTRHRRVLETPKRNNEKGAVIAIFALTLVVVLMATGMAVDLSLAFMRKSSLAKAVDAAALAAARGTKAGELAMLSNATDVAKANTLFDPNGDSTLYNVDITRPSQDAIAVSVTGTSQSPTVLSKILAMEDMKVSAAGEATRFPADVSLVLDLSMSLQRNNVFDDMQAGAGTFVDFFDDNLDQVGVSTFSTVGADELMPAKSFSVTAKSNIASLSAISDTNTAEGIRFGIDQLAGAASRPSAEKALVLFTYGRPTAACGEFRMRETSPNEKVTICHKPGTPAEKTKRLPRSAIGGHIGHGDHLGPCGSGNNNAPGLCEEHSVPETFDGCIATYINGNSWRGLFERSTGRKVVGFNEDDCSPITAGNRSSRSSPKPVELPDGSAVNGNNIRSFAAAESEARAEQARRDGNTVYVVALGNPNAVLEGDTPDLELLKRIANHRGTASASQPRGEMIFAPSAAELKDAFAETASKILVRMTR